jgi:CheY-like chemotaxis protein
MDTIDKQAMMDETREEPSIEKTEAITAPLRESVPSDGAVGRSVSTRPMRQKNATGAKARRPGSVRICSGMQRGPRLRTVDRDPVLLVDDDPSLVEAVKLGLESHGYPVVTASDGTEGLERLRSEHPCVVLLDLDMPGMNGWQFVERQQADPRLASIPVVVVSARDDATRQAHALHAAAGLQKPVDLDDVMATVRGQCTTA